MQRTIIELSTEQMQELLQLAPATRIVGMYGCTRSQSVHIVVEDPRLPDLPVGAQLLVVHPIKQRSLIYPWERDE